MDKSAKKLFHTVSISLSVRVAVNLISITFNIVKPPLSKAGPLTPKTDFGLNLTRYVLQYDSPPITLSQQQLSVTVKFNTWRKTDDIMSNLGDGSLQKVTRGLSLVYTITDIRCDNFNKAFICLFYYYNDVLLTSLLSPFFFKIKKRLLSNLQQF